MNLADLRAEFLHELNRKDCTDALADGYIAKALRRIQRELRLPCMECGMVFEATTEALASVLIPNDLIALIDVFVPTGASDGGGVADDGEFPLVGTSYRGLQQFPLTGPVCGYARLTNRLYFRGVVPLGSYVKLVYYGTEPALVDDTTETPIMAAAPELVRYAALAYAGIVYEKPQTADWESAYQSTKEAVDLQARDLDTMGGPMVIAPAYEG